jgi:uncharacterized membrane protein YheB (UPF0754 family)
VSDWLHVVLTWIAPPVIGAIIGFVTNDIAIRMLFRPLTEKRIFGIRIPFTPGIIPRQRRHLASSIGRMVSDELLTEDAVRAQIDTPRVQEALRENITGLTGSLLDLRLDEIGAKPLPLFQATFPELLSGFLSNFLQSPLFRDALAHLLDGFIDSLAQKPVRELVEELKLRPFLDEKLALLIEDDGLKEKLKAGLMQWARGKAGEDEPLSVLLTDGLVTTASGLFRSAFPFLLENLQVWLAAPEVRQNLEEKGKLLLNDILSKLNIFQRFFLSVGSYDRTLSEQMPGIVSDVLRRLNEAMQSEADREAVVQAFARALDNWRKKGFQEVLGDDPAALVEKISVVVDGLFEIVRRENLGRKLAGAAGDLLVARESETLASLTESLLGLSQAQITGFLIDRFTREDFAARAAERITAFALDFFKSRGELTLGGLLGVDREKKAAFDERAVTALNTVLGDKLPEALRSLDLRALVENKINGLDIKAVEGLLLMVIAKHLKWINIFGAILGGLIGLIQVVLKLFGIG